MRIMLMNRYKVITYCTVKTEYIVEADDEREAKETFGDSMDVTEFDWENEEIQSVELLEKNI
jgi:hypothetical protein